MLPLSYKRFLSLKPNFYESSCGGKHLMPYRIPLQILLTIRLSHREHLYCNVFTLLKTFKIGARRLKEKLIWRLVLIKILIKIVIIYFA